MRFVFLIGAGIGSIFLSIFKMDYLKITEDIMVWALTPTRSRSPNEQHLIFCCLLIALQFLFWVYTFYAPQLKIASRPVENHFDMLLCGIFTGILLRWLIDFGFAELLAGIGLFLLGFFSNALNLSKFTRHLSVHTLWITIWIISCGVFLMGLLNHDFSASLGGVIILICGIWTEYNQIRPIGGFAIQKILKYIVLAIGLIYRKLKRRKK